MTDSARLATRRDVGGSRSLWTALAVMLLTGAAVFAAGCSDDGGNSRLQRKSVSTEASREQLFRVAIENLNRLDEFNSPTMLRNIVDRLNDWSQAQPEVDYELPEFFAQLPPNVQRLAEVQSLGSARFDSRFDERHLQETIWLRDIADRTCGDQIDDVTRARELFDWTVRNIQLEPTPAALRVCDTDALELDAPKDMCRPSGLTLFTGAGNAIDRAWLFALLARQQRLPVVMLYHADPSVVNRWRFWLAAFYRPDDGELYLFDPYLGLPLPGPVPGDVLTLRQLRSDPNLLEQLAVDGEPYRLRYEQLKSVAAFVDTSPGYLAPRMRRVESRLTGQQSVVLASDPAELLDQLRTVGELAGAYPWQMPYKALFYSAEADGRRRISEATRRLNPSQVPPAMQQIAYNLGRGRTMYFKGKLTGPESATSYFQAARLSNEQIEAARITEEEKLLAMSIKQDASYWLGLAQYERGAYDTAIDYFLTRSLEAFPGGTWENGARYNLGRAYESIGDLDRAITLYRSGNSPQKHGNLLRARRLQQELEAAKSEETK